jgi:hypothetical protein
MPQPTTNCRRPLAAAVNRDVRVLKRLRDVFQSMPGGIESI